jgi:hypothetical protein
MTQNLIENCPPFPWILLLTRAKGTTLHVVRNALELERQMMARDLKELRFLGLGGPADPVAEIIQRSDAARHFLVSIAEKERVRCQAYLDYRNGSFEVLCHLHRFN